MTGNVALRFGLPSPKNLAVIPGPELDLVPDNSEPTPVPPIRDDYDADLEGPAIDARVVVQRMLRVSLAFFASEVVRGNITSSLDADAADQMSGRTFIADFHEEWAEIVRRHRLVCIEAPRDHGKCSPAGHLILRSDGARIPIEQWEGGEVLAYDPATYQLVPACSTPVHRNGVKRCLKIRTRTGREETVTENHPLRTLLDWKRADLLEIGDRIAVPRELAIDGASRVEDAWLLGVLTGDGGLTQKQVRFTSIDQGIANGVREICEKHGWILSGPRSGQEWFIGNKWLRSGSPLEWTRSHGLQGKNAYEKRAPKALFTAPRSDIAEFVAGFLDTDGHVSPHGGGCVEFYSVAVDLLRDVQHFLTRLGVVAVLALKNGQYENEQHRSWRLTVRGRSIIRLAKWLHPRSEGKAVALEALARGQDEKEEGGSIDLLPSEVYSKLKHGSDWFRQRGFPRYSRKYDLTRTKALALADAEGNEDLRALAEAEILWDEVVAIEDAGEQETYFITVPGLENYVGNDIINHNTHLLTLALPIWEAWRRPGTEIVIFSETQPQAEQRLLKIKQEIEGNTRLQHLRDPNCWSATQIRFSNGSTIYARGFGVRSRGMHPHLAICDDVVSETAMYSELIRQRQWQFFTGAVRQMVVPEGQIVVVGTPQHADDLYARLEANSEWFFKRYEAIDDADKVLLPERYSKLRLEKRRKEIGEIQFAREFLCRAISSGMSLFSDDLVTKDPFLQHAVRIGTRLKDGKLARPWWVARGVKRFYLGVDIARSANVDADYFVIFVVGLDDFGNRWVVDIFREKGLGYKTQKAKIIELAKLWRTELACIEGNVAQDIYGEEIREDTDVAIHLHFTGSEKHDLERGIPGMRVLFEAGKYRCPRGDDETIVITDQWIGELQGWTFTKAKGVVSVAKHDDVAMAHYLCEKAIVQGESFCFAFGEQPGDAEAAALAEAEEDRIVKEIGEDPWIMMGLEPGDMAAKRNRGNLDFGDMAGHHGGVVMPQNAHNAAPGPPPHPLGGGVPLWNLIGPRRFAN